MIAHVAWRDLPLVADNRLYLDYISGIERVASFFTHAPSDFSASLAARCAYPYPRDDVADRLAEYNAQFGASPAVFTNIEALRQPAAFCVTAGQQVGFLGGPMYTAYKIITTIRLAIHLTETLRVTVVPIFWLATEDHDFNEINHAYYPKADGEVGQVKFAWDQQGRPVADLPVSDRVTQAYRDYFEHLPSSPHLAQVREQFAYRGDKDYCTWHARIWSQLFSEYGLVIAEPTTLRPPAGKLFRSALQHRDEIGSRLAGVSQRLNAAGYEPSLSADTAGQMYTIDGEGHRIRVTEPLQHLETALEHPERYSTDAALRPPFADAMLPTLASVLGPGEIAYQAMLRPLYDLFRIPQPLLFPRKSYTIMARRESDRLGRYQMSATTILTKGLNTGAVLHHLVPPSETALFDEARLKVEAALTPLRSHLEEMDPNLGKTWMQTLNNSMRSIDKLESRATKVLMSKLGLSKGELQALRNVVLPRGRLQERVFPLPYFLSRHGPHFMDKLFSAGELDDFTHHILTIGDDDA